MNVREVGERVVTVETVIIGTGDGSDGLVKRFSKLEDKVNGLSSLMAFLSVAGTMIGFLIGIFVQIVLAKSH
jgi:hypothetical protein